MAEFCKQCADEHDFPESDFAGIPWDSTAEPLQPDHGYAVLCEGCGPTLVDTEGRCLTDCMRHHVPAPTVPPPL